MMLNDIKDFIVGAGLATAGVDLFIGMMPATVSSAVMLRQPFGTQINNELPGFHKSEFNIIVRSKDFESGELRAQLIADLIKRDESQLGSIYIKYLRQLTLPYSYPLSEGNNYESTIRMSICYVR